MGRNFKENTFTTSDNAELYYKHWESCNEFCDKAIVLLHRGHEHSGRLQHVVDELHMPEIQMFAWDARGHGKNSGARGFSPSVGRMIKDLDEFISHISEKYNVPKENIMIISQSVAAVVSLAWAHDYAPKIRGIVAASPAFDIKLYVPFAKQLLRMAQNIKGNFFVNSYVNANLLTHDKEIAETYKKDPLIAKAIASNILLGLYDVADRIINDAHAIKLPVQLFISNSDCVVRTEPEHKFYENLGSTIKEKHVLDGFYHDALGEKDREIAISEIRSFINKLYSMPLYQHDYSNEDRWSVTADTLRDLQHDPKCVFKRLFYSSSILMMKTLGRLSEGINLGIKTGFDSGSTLDYIYRNSPEGRLIIGKFLDKMYLESTGWKGIRQRKVNIEKVIQLGIKYLRDENKPVNIMDIAAGHGRYILDAIGNADNIDRALLRDYSELNVEKGSNLIKERGLENKVEFKLGDAFNRESLASVEPKPTLSIVSGLYELFPYNENIRTSLRGISDAMEVGSYLVYTNQPWHPQLELISKTLTSHRKGISWTMRCRVQGEMDSLVEEAGFEKICQLNDEDDIFTVSLARKIKE